MFRGRINTTLVARWGQVGKFDSAEQDTKESLCGYQ